MRGPQAAGGRWKLIVGFAMGFLCALIISPSWQGGAPGATTLLVQQREQTAAPATVERPPLHIVTVCSAPNQHTLNAQRIAESYRTKIEVQLLKTGGIWRFAPHLAWQEYCQNLTDAGRGDDLVMFLDAYDVVVAGKEEDIVDAYLATVQGSRTKTGDWPLLFSAEANCFPNETDGSSRACNTTGWYATHRPTDTPYKYLNCGSFMGPAKLIAWLIKENRARPDLDPNQIDQGFFQEVLHDMGEYIVLDHDTKVFWAFYLRKEDMECHSGKGWFNNLTQTYPHIIHQNGGPKDMIYTHVFPSYLNALDNTLPAPACDTILH
ncbi:hypothetical protein ABPG75_009826 [Micractinium tetrahymenae]